MSLLDTAGGVPQFLGQMQYLSQLNLSYNHLTQPFPANFNSISLSQLDVSNNQIPGPFPVNLVAAVQPITNLCYVDFSNNKLTGSIPEEVSTWSGLNYLHLGGNALTGSIPIHWGGAQFLGDLELSRNKLTGPGSLGALQSLSNLDNGDSSFRIDCSDQD